MYPSEPQPSRLPRSARTHRRVCDVRLADAFTRLDEGDADDSETRSGVEPSSSGGQLPDAPVQALRRQYPSVAAALGDAFGQVGAAWLTRQPASDRSQAHVAERFAEALPAGVSDLARLDDARRVVFDEVDDEAVSVDTLRGIPAPLWPTLRFARIAASRVLALQITVDDDSPDTEYVARPSTVLVWRVGTSTQVRHRRLDPVSRALATCLETPQPLERIAAALSGLELEDPLVAVSAALGRATQDGWLSLASDDAFM